MAKRSHTLVFTLVTTTTLMLFPSTARLQEQTAPAAPAASVAQENSTYTIIQGDTLWDISSSALKDPFLWPLIWKENPFIANPDLIYPGNKLIIPSLAPIERALQAPEETSPTAAPAPPERAEKTEPAASTNEIPAAPVAAAAPAPEKAPSKSGIIQDKETVLPLIDKYTMVNAGYVGTDTSVESIAGSLEPKSIFGFNDIVFIKVSNPETVKIGDKYLIFAPVKKVKHPKTGKKMGSLVKILGILQVTEKTPGAAYLTARITLSFDSSSKGSLLVPHQEPALIYSVPNNDGRNIEGHIIEVMDRRSINANFDMLYLDKGSSDGVKPGDRFTVFIDALKKGFPRKIIGEALVVLVKDATATALVRVSSEAITKGDRVELTK